MADWVAANVKLDDGMFVDGYVSLTRSAGGGGGAGTIELIAQTFNLL